MIRVRVPATSANLGPGFDSVGLALDLYNEFYFIYKKNEEIPEGCTILYNKSLAHKAITFLAQKVNKPVPDLKVYIRSMVPRSRGLGSSATLTVAGLMAANYLLEANYDKEKLITLASGIEGHPDNVAPAFLGGLVISITTPQGIKFIKFMPRKPLQAVVAVPDFELSTPIARKVLPQTAPYQDVVYNTGRFGFFVASLLTGDYSNLSVAMDDLLHQPYRLPLVTGMQEVMRAALESGALGCCLSGAGPSILAFCDSNCQEISTAMKNSWKNSGIEAELYILHIDSEGARFEIE